MRFIPEATRTTATASLSANAQPDALNFSDSLARSGPAGSAQSGASPSGSVQFRSVQPSSKTIPSSAPPATFHASLVGPVRLSQAAQPAARLKSNLSSDDRETAAAQARANWHAKEDESGASVQGQNGVNLAAESDAKSKPVCKAANSRSDSDPGTAIKGTAKSAKTHTKPDAQNEDKAAGLQTGSSVAPVPVPPTLPLSDALGSMTGSLLLPTTQAGVAQATAAIPAATAAASSASSDVPTLTSVSLADAQSAGTQDAGANAMSLSAAPVPASSVSPSSASSALSSALPLFMPASLADSAQTKAGPNSFYPAFSLIADSPGNESVPNGRNAAASTSNINTHVASVAGSTSEVAPATPLNDAPDGVSSAPFSNPLATGSAETLASASDATLISIRQRVPGLSVSVSDPIAAGRDTIDNVALPSTALANNAVPNNALTGDASHLHSEPASPAPASSLSSAAVGTNASAVPSSTGASAVTASPIASKPAVTASVQSSPASPSALASFQVVAPAASNAQSSAPEPAKPKPVAPSGAGSAPAKSSADSVASQAPAASAPPQTVANKAEAAPGTSVPGGGPSADANTVAAASPSVTNSASNLNSPSGDLPATTTTEDDSKNPTTKAQASLTRDESAATLQERKPGASFPLAASSASVGGSQDAAAGSTLAPPAPVLNATTAALSENPGSPSPLPPAHQMLDSAPTASLNDGMLPQSTAHVAPDAVLQMHIGIHTNAFGNVEIRTVVEQSQVGVAIHGDHDLARWFSSEVSGLEAGLKSQHLNLTGVDFGSNRSGVQTATSFQQGQPQQNSPHTPGSYAAALPSEAAPPEPEITSDPTAPLPAQLAETRVSILV